MLSPSTSPVVVLYLQAVGTKEWREVSEATFFILQHQYHVYLSARYVRILLGMQCN